MPLVLNVGVVRRTKAEVEINWKESQAKAFYDWLERYFREPWEPIFRCPHGVMCEEDAYEGAPSNYCTICQDIRVKSKPRLKPYGMAINHPLRLRLATFPRKGVRYLEQRGILGGHFYPGDHEVCPYDPKFRMRSSEACGYIRSGPNDGVAVRAVRPVKVAGFVWDDLEDLSDADDDALSECASRIPSPTWSARLGWHYPEGLTLVRPRRKIVVVPFLPETPRLDFASSQNYVSHWGDFHEERKPKSIWDEAPRTSSYEEPNPAKDLWFYNQPHPRMDYTFASWRPAEPTKERINQWQRQYWRERTKYIPPPSRDWPKGWRTERKMRDLDARLELFDYGGRMNVPRMMKTTARREREAWVDERWISGINWKQQSWPEQAPTQQSERGPRLLHGETKAARYGSRAKSVFYITKRPVVN